MRLRDRYHVAVLTRAAPQRLVVRRLYQKLLRAQQLLLFAAPVEEGGGEDADDQLFATVARAEAAQQLAAGLQTALAQLRERDLAPLFGDEASAAAASGVLQRRVEADYDALAAFAAAQLASLPVRMSLEEAKAAAAEAAARREGLRDGASTRVKAELELLREQARVCSSVLRLLTLFRFPAAGGAPGRRKLLERGLGATERVCALLCVRSVRTR